MPNRIIKESIWTSPNLNKLSALAELHFYRLLPLPDDYGCFEATPLVVKGKVYPLRTNIRVSDIEKWHHELSENSIIRFWAHNGRVYGQFINFDKHQRVRSLHQRKTPVPPPLADDCRQVPTDDGLNPIPIPRDTNVSCRATECSTANGAPPYDEIIAYLNQSTGKNFQSSMPENRKLIKARWQQFPSIEAFHKVISTKVAQWKGDAQNDKYLRPFTLFGTKFESYLNEAEKPKGKWDA